MPTQTTNLFLLEDLEDVGRTSELAESDLWMRSPSIATAPDRAAVPSGL
jgi:hypothetical protein